MKLSVIIPTHNRCRILESCLRALYKQDLPEDKYEIIVVDDGSRDETKSVVAHFIAEHENLIYLYQENQGQGIARNTGLKSAKGEIVVFIGDDIITVPDFLSQHLRYHLRYPDENQAVLGFTTWHPDLNVTPFMNWLTNGSSILGKFGGHQFAYEKLEGKKEADYNFFYTSNISLKHSLIDKYPFDPSFSSYGWEDIELGYRLHNRVGLKLYYNPKAIGYHYHIITEESLADRMRNVGSSAYIFHRKYPELNKVPPIWKQSIFWLISNPVSISAVRAARNITQGDKFNDLYYYVLSKKYFLEGLHNRR